MSAALLVWKLECEGATITPQGDKLFVNIPKRLITPELQELRKHKTEILRLLQSSDVNEYLGLLRSDEVLNSQHLPPVPTRIISDTACPERAEAWSAWWDAVEEQRRRGIIGKARIFNSQNSDSSSE